MHVYLRDEPVVLEMREVDGEGLADDGTGLIPVAFYVLGNQRPSFRALLPPETLVVLEEATQEPVQVGLLAEEPEDAMQEIRAMVGVSIRGGGLPDGLVAEEEEIDEDDDAEPWSNADPEAWKSSAHEEDGGDDTDVPRTVLLAFAPLVRLARKFPLDFNEELADLLETALAGETKPNLQARVDRMLGDL